MAVTIPQLQKVQSTSLMPKNDRINFQAQDQAQNILSRTGDVVSLGDQVGKIYQAYEDNKIDTLSNEAEQEFTKWNNDKLNRLKSYEGDPTDAFASYDEEAKSKREEILSKRPDLNDRVKRHLTSKLDKVIDSQYIHVLKQRGAQQDTYDNNLDEASLKMKKDGLAINAGLIQKDDPSSFIHFDRNIDEIKTQIAKRGLKKGTVTQLPDDAKTFSHAFTDEEGKLIKVQFTDLAKQRTAKELSEGVKNSLDVLVAGGQIEEAKQLRERYKGFLDPIGSKRVDNKIREYDNQNAGYEFLGSISHLSLAEQNKKINEIDDYKLKSEVLKIKDTNEARLENMRQRKQDNNYERLAKKIIAIQSSDNPYFGQADLDKDSDYKLLKDNLTARDLEHINSLVKAPSESDPKAVVEMQNLILGSDSETKINEISPEKFSRYMSKLSNSDRKKYNNFYEKLRNPSASQERAMHVRAEKMLTDSLYASGYLKKNEFGKFDERSEKRLIQAKSDLLDSFENKTFTNEKELKDHINEYSSSVIKGEVFQAPTKKVFNPNVSKNQQTESSLSDSDKLKLRRKFKDQYGRWPDINSAEYLKFVNSNQ